MGNYETVSGTSHTGGLIGVFMVGWFFGMVTCFMVTLWAMSGEIIIHSKTIIIPEKQLTTDGKTIDTLYIYKQ
jgi:hypothetical protein